jgi:hypothetical protein
MMPRRRGGKEGLLFREKEAKSFYQFWLRRFRRGSAQIRKSLLLLFFRKEDLFLPAVPE